MDTSAPCFREIPFGSDDYLLATALRDQVLRQPLGLKFSEVDLEREGGYRHFGIFAEATLLATVMMVPRPESWWQVRQMAVAFDRQGTGLGRQLLEAAEGRLRADGVARLYLHARHHAIGFYERLGYHGVGDPFTEVGIAHRRMEKTLAGLSDRQASAPTATGRP